MRDDEVFSLFIHECAQQIDEIDALLLEAEPTGRFSAEAIERLFRLAHTLKGSTAMMGYTALSEVTHQAENVLQGARRDAGAISEALWADIIARGFDFSAYCRGALERLRNGGQADGDEELSRRLSELSAALEQDEKITPQSGKGFSLSARSRSEGVPEVAQAEGDTSAGEKSSRSVAGIPRFTPGGATTAPNAAPARAPERPGDIERFTRYQVRLRPCAMAALRAFLIYRAVRGVSARAYTVPAELQSHPEFDGQVSERGFELGFIPKEGVDGESVRALIKRQALVERATLIAAPGESGAATAKTASALVSVSQERVNSLIDSMNEVLAARTALERHLSETGRLDARTERLMRALERRAVEAAGGLGELGMTELKTLFLRMQRLARDLLANSGKQADVLVSGGELALDKSVLEALNEMLLHVVRNAVDHGIEPESERVAAGKPARGEIRLDAQKRNGRLRVTVSDDGRGVNAKRVLAAAREKGLLTKPAEEYTRPELYSFLLLSGFSTKEAVSQTSGRGVGMDAVRHMVNKIGGRMRLTSDEGRGSQIEFDLPLSLNTADALRVTAERTCYVPVSAVERVISRCVAAGADVRIDGRKYEPLLPEWSGDGGFLVLFLVGGSGYYLPCREIGECGAFLVKPLPGVLARLLGDDNPYSGCVQDALGGVWLLLNVEKLAARQDAKASLISSTFAPPGGRASHVKE